MILRSESSLVEVFANPTLLAAIGAAGMGVFNFFTGRKTNASVQEVHLTMNSRLDQMIEAAEKIGYARGIKDALDAHNAAIAAAVLARNVPKEIDPLLPKL